MGQPAVKTAPTVEKPPEIPAELAPRLWRPVIRLEERSGVRVLIGPGYASSREALDWTDRKIAYNGRYRRSTAAARRNAWRNARLQLVLTVKIPVLDHGVPERRRVQKLVRNAAADRARAGRPAGVVGDAAPGDRPTLTDAVKAVAPKRVKQLAAVAGPGQRNRMKITDAEAEESAAALLLGMGRRMRRTASVRRRGGPGCGTAGNGGRTCRGRRCR